MNRQQKELVIKQLSENGSASQAMFLVGYSGLTVTQMQLLRKQLREQGGSLKVAKMRLIKRAAQEAGQIEPLVPYLKNQLAIVFSEEEPPAVAKVLYDFAKDNEKLKLVAGCLDSEFLSDEAITRIAQLPTKEVLYAQLCGTLMAPASRLVFLLKNQASSLLGTLKQVGELKQ